jgi:GT2 family glycosyltransferase
MLKPKVSVVIVSFNTREKLKRCLQCIEPEHETIVVDNASADGSAEMVATEFPWIKLVRNSVNAGFGAANNRGCLEATGDLVLFLNSDAYADPGAITQVAEVFQDPEVVGAGGKLLNPDRTLQSSTANRLSLWAVLCEQVYLEKLFPKSTMFSPYWTTGQLARSDTAQPTAQVMGACLMVRANAGRPVERFDERYFLYCEDTDLCSRLSKHGRLVYVPRATFIHELGSSSANDPAGAIIRYNRGKELYFLIHHGRAAAFVCLLLDRLGAVLRLVAWLTKLCVSGFGNQHAKRQVGAFWRVLTA